MLFATRHLPNTPRPVALQLVFQGFWFAESAMRVTDNIADQGNNALVDFLVSICPVVKVLKSALLEGYFIDQSS
jgi:hypothetical protein